MMETIVGDLLFGVVVPAAVFALSFVSTYLLYRYFTKKQDPK